MSPASIASPAKTGLAGFICCATVYSGPRRPMKTQLLGSAMEFPRLMMSVMVTVLIVTQVPVLAEVYPVVPAGVPASPDFRVWVNGQEIFTGWAGDKKHKHYSFCTFDFTGTATVKVCALRAVKWLDILPSALKIDYTTLDDYTFEFRLEEPAMLTLLVNNDKDDALHLLTSRPEKEKPEPSDKNVLYYPAGKIYEVGILDLHDNQTLYLEGGAVLKGTVRVKDASNVRIMGRGMIDGSDNISNGNDPEGDEPWRLIYMQNSSDIEIEGITLYNSRRWTIHPYDCHGIGINNIRVLNWQYGSDGTDISACQDVRIANSFYRTNDDAIAIKALSFSDVMYYPNPRIKNPNVENILVEGCTIWNMPYGNVFEIGFELRCDHVRNVVFRDCDVVMQDLRGAVFSIHNSDNAVVENVLYEDIRVENVDLTNNHKLIDLAILFSMWSYDRYDDPKLIKKHRYNDAWDNLLPVLPGKEQFHARHRGRIRGIRFRNVQVLDGRCPYSVISGYDEDHLVEDVTFENITSAGRSLSNAEELRLYQKHAKNIVFK